MILGIMLGAGVVVFALQNTAVISVFFLSWQIQASLAIIVILAVAAGVLICLLVSLPDVIRKSYQILRLKNKTEALKEELADKSAEVEVEKSKVEANNAYLDSLDRTPRV